MQATSYPFSVLAKELSKGWTLNHCLDQHHALHNVEFRIEFRLIARLIPSLILRTPLEPGVRVRKELYKPGQN